MDFRLYDFFRLRSSGLFVTLPFYYVPPRQRDDESESEKFNEREGRDDTNCNQKLRTKKSAPPLRFFRTMDNFRPA